MARILSRYSSSIYKSVGMTGTLSAYCLSLSQGDTGKTVIVAGTKAKLDIFILVDD